MKSDILEMHTGEQVSHIIRDEYLYLVEKGDHKALSNVNQFMCHIIDHLIDRGYGYLPVRQVIEILDNFDEFIG